MVRPVSVQTPNKDGQTQTIKNGNMETFQVALLKSQRLTISGKTNSAILIKTKGKHASQHSQAMNMFVPKLLKAVLVYCISL